MTVAPVALVRERLALIFPPGLVSREPLVRELAARTVAVFLYAGAVGDPDLVETPKVRPSMVAWMTDGAYEIEDRGFRAAWHAAACKGNATVRKLLESQGIPGQRWYAENTREPIRDEIIRPLERDYGAIHRRSDLAPTSSAPALTLDADFAALFNPGVDGAALQEAVELWRSQHLGSAQVARLRASRRLNARSGAVRVDLPGRGERQLPPGASSVLTAEVITALAPCLLDEPYVLAVLHPRDPVASEDAGELESVGLSLESAVALPDVVLIDAADGTIWFIEVVVSDGPIDEARRANLLSWARSRGVDETRCRFVTAYQSRTAGVFRRTVASLAWSSSVWFADEPGHLVDLRALSS